MNKNRTVVLDSSVWVAYLSEKDKFHQQAKTLVVEFIAEECIILIPIIVLIEVLAIIKRRSFSKESKLYFLNLINKVRNITFIDTLYEPHLKNIQLFLNLYGLKAPDTLILFDSINQNALLYSFDMALTRAYNLAIINTIP